MSDLLNILVPIFITVLGAILNYLFSHKKKDELLSEDIEEITKADGSKIKKHKKRYK